MSEYKFSVERMISGLEERDLRFPIDAECDKFHIGKGDVVIDYGCGSGGYTKKISELVGESGKVYAVDIYHEALDAVKRKITQRRLSNIETVLEKDIDSMPGEIADSAIAVDMFHMVVDTNVFFKNLHRLIKKSGALFITTHHMEPDDAREKILTSGLWTIESEMPHSDARYIDHEFFELKAGCLKCLPVK